MEGMVERVPHARGVMRVEVAGERGGDPVGVVRGGDGVRPPPIAREALLAVAGLDPHRNLTLAQVVDARDLGDGHGAREADPARRVAVHLVRHLADGEVL